MSTATEQEVQAYLDSVESMWAKKQITLEDYQKCLVSLAWEFMSAGGQGERRAYSLLNRVGDKYFEPGGTCYRQAAEDAVFGVVIIKLAFKLLQYGLVGGDENIYGVTQRPGEA